MRQALTWNLEGKMKRGRLNNKQEDPRTHQFEQEPDIKRMMAGEPQQAAHAPPRGVTGVIMQVYSV